MSEAPAVALANGGWGEALAQSGFWGLLGETASAPRRVLILVDLSGARSGDPGVIAAADVEALIDLIHDTRPGTTVDLASSADETQLWAGNRDIYALADLLGYRFETDGGHAYDIVDLGENLTGGGFPEASVLRGSQLARDWLEADVRLNLARLRSDPAEGFAAGLMNLLCCLPLADKALHYRSRRDLGEVIAALLARCPPDHTLIDLPPPSEEAGNLRFAVASPSPVLADMATALKAGLDPFVSPLVGAVAAAHPPPPGYRLLGGIEPLPILPAPTPIARASTRERRRLEAGDRLLSGWLRGLDDELFPPARPIDARGATLARDLAGDGSSPSGNALVTAANLLLGAAGRALESWRTLFDKDALVQREVSLGFDPGDVPEREFAGLAAEIEALLPLAAVAPERGPGLRWRKFENAVLFRYCRTSPIPFDAFVARVDVARTISYLNDYLGGVVIVLDRDAAGRPVRQAERNLYLPQPNFLALYGGKPIDVSKIETVRYEPDAHRLLWKTIRSCNGSATADDGLAWFERDGDGTRITIVGKQRFTLPPLLQLFDLALLPELEAQLTTQAYQQFFDRTYANFEALVEGREIKLGHSADAAPPHPSVTLESWLASAAERAGPYLTRLKPAPAPRPEPDARGFVHVVPPR